MKNFFDLKFILIFSLTIVIYLLYNELNKVSKRLGLVELNFNNMIEYTNEHITEKKPINNNQSLNNPLVFNYDLVPDLLRENINPSQLVEKSEFSVDSESSINTNSESSDNISDENSSQQNSNQQNSPQVTYQPDNIQLDNNQIDNNQLDNNQIDNNQLNNIQLDNIQLDNNQSDNTLKKNNIIVNDINSDTELSEVVEEHDDNIVDNTLEEFSNDTDNNDIENNQIYSNDNEDENHTSNMESLEDMTKNMDELDITALLKNNKLIDLQKMAELLEIKVNHNNGKRKTKLSLAQDIIDKKSI